MEVVILMKILSIIIPIYNSEKTLEKCINSVIDIKDIEIILINDGSTDKTREICLKYQNKYDNVVVIQQENSGPRKSKK